MFDEIKFNDITGKTIKSMLQGHGRRHLLLAFEDETFACISVDDDWEIHAEEFDKRDYPDDGLVKAGVMTWDEINDGYDHARREHARKEAAAELELYKRLKLKYEPLNIERLDPA